MRRPSRMLLIGQAVVVAALTATLTAVLLLPRQEQAVYATLMEAEALPSGRFIRVVVHPEASEAAIEDVLRRLELDVVAGPSGRGVYTLLPSSPDAWQQAMAALEREPQVLFVQGISTEANR